MPPTASLRSLALLAWVAVTAAPVAPARAAPEAAAPERAQGSVLFVTSARAYLNRGAADGLARGKKVVLLRHGARVADCTLDAVSDHAAACPTTAARPGDAFAATARPAPPVRESGVTLPPPTEPEVEHARTTAVAQAPVTLVEFHPPPRPALGGAADVALGSVVYLGGESGVATEVDVRLSHVPLGAADLRFDLALSAVRWQPQLDGARFRPDVPTQLYVWEAELSRREPATRTVLAVGRVWPWHVPGVPVLDGVQVGRRNEAHTVEAGVYGGLLPSRLTLAPAFEWTTGAYVALEQPGARGDVVRFAREQLRAATRRSLEIGDVRELEAVADVTTRLLWGAAGGRLRHAAAVDAHPVLETAFAELQLRPGRLGGALVQLRHIGVAPELEPLLVNETPALLGGLHAAGSAWVNLGDALTLGATGRFHLDRDTDRREADASVDVQLPTLFAGTGGLWLSAFDAEGWMRSRGLAAQMAAGGRGLRVVARVDGATTRFAPTDGVALGPGLTSTEAGAYLHVELRLARALRLRTRSRVRVPLSGAPATSRAAAAVLALELVAAF